MTWRQTEASPEGVRPSRAINIDADHGEVRAACEKKSLDISAIEPLLSGGTRVVMRNGDDAASIRRMFKAKLLLGPVMRTAWASR